MSELFAANLAALAGRSPRTAERVAASEDDGGFTVGLATNGEPVVLKGGRAYESLRNPSASVLRQAASGAGHVAVAGIGTGYLAEALLAAGRSVEAILEGSPEALAAAMRARDLRSLLGRVPCLLPDSVRGPVDAICLKTNAPEIVALGPRAADDAWLGAMVAGWPRLPVADRPPRVLIVGPILGGSLETARSTARAAEAAGALTRFLDFGPFGAGWDALGAASLSGAAGARAREGLATTLSELAVQVAEDWSADLVIALAQAPLAMPSLARLRQAGHRTAFWFVENGRELTYWTSVAPGYDHFFAIQGADFLEEVSAAGSPHVVHLPTACDAARHAPLELSAAERERFAADVSFAGSPYPNRRRLLAVLADLGLRLWGEGWDRTELAAHAAEGGRRFCLDEMVRVFAGTRVNVNLHSSSTVDGFDPEPDYVNPRTFELACCGAFQLVDARTGLRSLFSAEEVAAFGTARELRDLASWYIGHPDERSAMAARARTRALADHTFEHRVRRIFEEALPPVLAAGAALGLRVETLDEAVERLSTSSGTLTAEEAALRMLQCVRDRRV